MLASHYPTQFTSRQPVGFDMRRLDRRKMLSLGNACIWIVLTLVIWAMIISAVLAFL